MARKSKLRTRRNKSKHGKYKKVRRTKRRTRRNRNRKGGGRVFDTIKTAYRNTKERFQNYRNKYSKRGVDDSDINDRTGKLRNLGNKTKELKEKSGNYAETARKIREKVEAEAEKRANQPWYRNIF